MRKIVSGEVREKQSKRNQMIIGIVLLLLMIISTLGFAFINNTSSNSVGSDSVDYNDVRFTREFDYWKFTFNNYEFLTRYNSQETSDITVPGFITLQDYVNKPLYFVGENGDHFLELQRNLDRFALRISEACLDSCEKDLPIKNCKTDTIIVYKEVKKEDEKERIYQEDKCVYIISRIENRARYADALLFKLLGL